MKTDLFSPARLPLLGRVIFVDWNGVLSCDPFFVSITQSRRHPLGPKLREALWLLFKKNNDIVNRWMRGELSKTEVIRFLGVSGGTRFSADVLERFLVNDCKQMTVSKGLVDLLLRVIDSAYLVIATDNMDCFVEQARALRKYRQVSRNNLREYRMKDVLCFFDDVLCSSSLGFLKRENTEEFFGPWLRNNGLGFKDALLLDDVEKNGLRFRERGGSYVKIEKGDIADGFGRVSKEIEAWLAPAECRPEQGATDAEY